MPPFEAFYSTGTIILPIPIPTNKGTNLHDEKKGNNNLNIFYSVLDWNDYHTKQAKRSQIMALEVGHSQGCTTSIWIDCEQLLNRYSSCFGKAMLHLRHKLVIYNHYCAPHFTTVSSKISNGQAIRCCRRPKQGCGGLQLLCTITAFGRVLLPNLDVSKSRRSSWRKGINRM